MKVITILSNQRLIDVAIQELGDVDRLFELCLLNDLDITDELAAGDVLVVPDFDYDKRRLVSFFSDSSLSPASADDEVEDMLVVADIGGSYIAPVVNEGQTVFTLDNQRLIDTAIQELGDVERIFELCLLNNLSITDDIEPGTRLLVPQAATNKKMIVGLYSSSSVWPACADDGDILPMLPPGGIGFMQIGNTFIVS